jgi:iron(III) transport system permease protein
MTRWRVAVGLIFVVGICVPVAAPYGILLEESGGWDAWREGPRLLSLVLNTVKLVSGTLLIAIPLGVAGAVLLYRTDLPFSRLLRFLIVLTLFVPLPLFTSAWQAAFGTGGMLPWDVWNRTPPGDPDISPIGIAWKPWGQGLLGAIWVHTAAGLPWVILLVGQGLAWVERELEEDASLVAGPWLVLRYVTLPRSRAAIVAAGLWVALAMVTEITVTDMMQVRTFAEEVYTQLVAGDRLALAHAVAVSIPTVLLTTALVAWVSARWERDLPPMETLLAPPRPIPLGHWRWPCLIVVLVIATGYAGVPVASLLWKAGLAGNPQSWSSSVAERHLWNVFRVQSGMVVRSLLLAALTGGITAGFALLLSWLALGSRWFRGGVFLMLAIVLATSGPVLGLGLKTVIAASLHLEIKPLADVLYYGPSPVPAVWAHWLRFLPYAVAILWPIMRLVPRELREAIQVDGARPRHEFAYLIWPLLRGTALCAALAVMVLSLGELGASKLVETAGSRTFAHEVFDQMHYGVGNNLAALCLVLLAIVLVGGAVVRGVGFLIWR